MIEIPQNNVAVKRCAVYTRKSNENGLEQEFNSLDAQRDAAENYITHIKNLIDLEDTFAALIEDLMQGKGTLGVAFIPISEKLDHYKTLSKERRQQLNQLLSIHPEEQDNGMVVSPQELRELLQD